MNLWYKKALVFVAAGLAYGVGIFFSNPGAFGFCSGAQAASYLCGISSAINIGWSFADLGQVLVVIALILLFANARSFRAWLRFSYWFVPLIALIIIFIFPIPFPLGAELSRYRAVATFGKLYAIITFLIILIHYLRSGHKRGHIKGVSHIKGVRHLCFKKRVS